MKDFYRQFFLLTFIWTGFLNFALAQKTDADLSRKMPETKSSKRLSSAADSDWPMWRYDAARSAASPIDIADNPVLLWSRKLPPVRSAWPLEPNQRLNFDSSYEPVAMGKQLFLGSPNDGSVTAYNTETGEEKWKFFTEGPVRCALACWSPPEKSDLKEKARVLAGSDDGWLYCLDAESGDLIWKFRGAPKDRPDRRQIGNGHLVSLWPVRGGPVIKDDIVYFAAGIWPIFGVFIHALDLKTGKVKWSNSDLNFIKNVRWLAVTGLSPQGNLGIVGNKLVVPCGRALPAVLNADTGDLIQYFPGKRRGECRIALYGDYAFVGEQAMMDLKTGCEISTPKDYARTYSPYKIIPGCDAYSAFDDGISYGFQNGQFYSYDLNEVEAGQTDIKHHGRVVKNAFRWKPKLRWKFQTPYKGKPRSFESNRPANFNYNNIKSKLTIKAGNRIYSHLDKTLICLMDLDGPPKVAWEKTMDSVPTSLIAADGKLFVATADGAITCFGDGKKGGTYDGKPLALKSKNDHWIDKAKEIVKVSGVKSGYCLVLGLKEGRLLEELLNQTDLILLAVDEDAKKINALKTKFEKAGFLGSRVELFTAKPFDFLFPPYIASLIVSEKHIPIDNIGKLFNTLRPYGGTLCAEMSDKDYAKFADAVKSANLAKGVLKRDGNWSMLFREGPLPGATPWSHMGADAQNTFCSKDDLVRSPLGFLWYGDLGSSKLATGRPGGWGSIVNIAVSGGRVFQANCSTIMAYDAYTGRVLWNKIPARGRWSAIVAMPDWLYFAIGTRCFVLDPETGKTIKEFKLKTNKSESVDDMRVEGDYILIACRKPKDPSRGPYYRTMSEIGKSLICLDRETGKELWRRDAKERFHSHALAMGSNIIFCVDSTPVGIFKKAGKKTPKQMTSTVLALDAKTGKVLWSHKVNYDATRKFTPQEYLQGMEDQHVRGIRADDWLAYSEETGLVIAGRYLTAGAWDGTTGKKIWGNKDIRGSAPMIIRGKTLVTSGGDSHDLMTGERIKNYKSVRKRSCNYAIGGKHHIFVRGAGDKGGGSTRATCAVSYYDVKNDKAYQLRNIRPSCRNNLIAADGLVNSPCYTSGDCICNYPIQTSFALFNMPEVDEWAGDTPIANPTPPTPPQNK